MPDFTYDQIAYQLTNGYWGGSARAFDTGVNNTLYVDVTGLTASGQSMALQALEAWSLVSGISFVEVSADTAPNTTFNEGGDAPGTTATPGQSTEGILSRNLRTKHEQKVLSRQLQHQIRQNLPLIGTSGPFSRLP